MSAELIVYEDSLVIHKVNGEEMPEYSRPQIGGGVVNEFDPDIKQDGTLYRAAGRRAGCRILEYLIQRV